MKEHIVIYWCRQDLRLADNPALIKAASCGRILPIYIFDHESAGKYSIGAASRCWLHASLKSLNVDFNGSLNFYLGNAELVIKTLIQRYSVSAVYWNRCYEPWQINRDKRIKLMLKENNIDVETFNASLLWEPWEILKSDSSPYKVFTPFYKNGCLQAHAPRLPLSQPEALNLVRDPKALLLKDLDLLPKMPWRKTMMSCWHPGEKAAQNALHHFLENSIHAYQQGRDFPSMQAVSRLSPHLHFGEISPNHAWYAAQLRGESDNVDHFCRELIWREFSYYWLFHFPELPYKNLQSKFDRFPWGKNPEQLKKWQLGQTGYPFIDAGMRELWQTGYMHNRVRMVVASFLVKNLLIDWREGAGWFWDCLVDADLASNSASWQWVAGCGIDAAPYFRLFNPVTQGQKFDPDGQYTRRFLPELKDLPNRYLFQPWEAPLSVLEAAGINLGVTYPYPIVDLRQSRATALEAFSKCFSSLL